MRPEIRPPDLASLHLMIQRVECVRPCLESSLGEISILGCGRSKSLKIPTCGIWLALQDETDLLPLAQCQPLRGMEDPFVKCRSDMHRVEGSTRVRAGRGGRRRCGGPARTSGMTIDQARAVATSTTRSCRTRALRSPRSAGRCSAPTPAARYSGRRVVARLVMLCHRRGRAPTPPRGRAR